MRFYAFEAKTKRTWTSALGEGPPQRAARAQRRVKALGSNSLKCPVARKKPLRLKNTSVRVTCVCMCSSTPATQSIAFRVLFLFDLGIILVFMVPIKVHYRPFSFLHTLFRFTLVVSYLRHVCCNVWIWHSRPFPGSFIPLLFDICFLLRSL